MTAIPTTSNPNSKVPGATPATTTPATTPNLGAGYKLPAGAVVNSYGQTVLNPNIGSALAPLAIPPVSNLPAPAAKIPAPTPPKPPAPAPAAKAPPAAPAGGNSGSTSGNSGNSGNGSGSGSTAPVITLAPSSAKGGTSTNADGSLTFTPTGNVPTDLAALAAAGADALTISYYMSIYGNSWNYGIGSQGMSKNIPQTPEREVSGHMLTTNTPGMSQAEANAVAILNKAGLTQQAVKSQAVYVFTDPTNPRAQISVSKAAYDASTPAQQLAIQIQVGNIPKGATIPKSAIVNGVWNGDYTVPGNNKVQSSGPTPITKYTTTNADGSQSVNLAAALAGGVTADYLIQQGFTKQQITQAQEYNSVMTTLKPYTNSAGTNLAAALASGKVTPQQLEDVGFSNDGPKSAIQAAEQYNALQTILNNPKNGIVNSKGNADLAKAIANGNLTTDDLITLGFNQQAVYASAVLVSNFGYSAKGYTSAQLQQMVSSGKITKADLISAGFDSTTVNNLSNPKKAAPAAKTNPALKQTGPITASDLVSKIENETIVQKGASAASQPKLNTSPTMNISKIEANSQGIKISLAQKIINKVGNIAGAVTKEGASLKASLDAAKAKSPVFQSVSNNEKGGAITSLLNKLSHAQSSNNNVNGINSVSNGLMNLAPGSGFSTFIESDAGVETASGGSLTPVALIAALAAIGIYVGATESQNIENAITHWKQTHQGQAPTSSQVTLTDSTGKSVTLAQVANASLTSYKNPAVLPHPTGEVKLPGVLAQPLNNAPPTSKEGMDIIENPVPTILEHPTTKPIENKEGMDIVNNPIQPVLKSTATAGGELTGTQAVGKTLTPGQLQALWDIGEGNDAKGMGIRPAYYSSSSLEQLDQIILKAYYAGAITQEELQEYERAKEKYLKAKAKSDTAVGSATNSVQIPKSISKGQFIAAVSAATIAAIATQNATKAQQATAIKQAIYISTGVESQTAVQIITQTAQQIATQQAVKAGLQTQTQQAIKEATQSKTAEQEGIHEQEQTQEQEQTKAQSMEQAVSTQTATATEEATNESEKENENEAENENETAAKLPKPKNKPTGGTAELTAKDIANATAHRAGFGWYLFVNNRWQFLKELPPGAKPVKSGKGSGYASVQTIRGKPVIAQHRMGAVTVTINRPGYQPGMRGAIAYHGNGAGPVRPHMDMKRQGKVINIKGVGLTRLVPHGRVVR